MILFKPFCTELIGTNITILRIDSNLEVSKEELSAHNINLISTLQERESIYENSINSQGSSIMQNRVIYMGLLGIIVALIFRKKKNIYNSKIYIFLLVLTIIFYSFDIHQKDLLKRSIETKGFTSKDLNLLGNLKPTDTYWYYIDDEKKTKFLNENSEFLNRILRKTKKALQPEFAQWVYYIFPMFAIYFWLIIIFKYHKKKNGSDSQKSMKNNKEAKTLS